MKFIQTLLITTFFTTFSYMVSANQAEINTTVKSDIVKGPLICPSWPDCPQGSNEEKPPAKTL